MRLLHQRRFTSSGSGVREGQHGRGQGAVGSEYATVTTRGVLGPVE